MPDFELGPVRVWLGESGGRYPDGNQVLVQGADTLAAFDTPLVSDRLGSEFEAADLVILGHVHEDHVAGLHRVKNAAVHVHTGDVEAARSWDGLARHYGYSPEILAELHTKLCREFHYQPRADALAYRDGTVWQLGGGVSVRAIHMPGHTSGHSVLMVEPGDIAFVGDIDLSSFGPYYGDATSSLSEFRATLKRLRTLHAQVWITSHHKGVITDRTAFLAALDAFERQIQVREDRLLALLDAGPQTLEELVQQRILYRPGAKALWLDSAERRSISQHLAELMAQSIVGEIEGGRFERLRTLAH
jgi:glyoxylase-like metal-dependent hydrolase (beta-lactamase superfamily II)